MSGDFRGTAKGALIGGGIGAGIGALGVKGINTALAQKGGYAFAAKRFGLAGMVAGALIGASLSSNKPVNGIRGLQR
jgi:hypothetical protein